MLSVSKIPYLDFGWSAISGCNGPVNPATGEQERCPYCYLAAMRARFGQSMDPVFRAERLADPLHRRKPAIIGLLGGDLFDPAFTDEQIAAVYGVMAATPQHTYIIPTKQAARMEAWFRWASELPNRGEEYRQGAPVIGYLGEFAIRASQGAVNVWMRAFLRWPLPNVWQLVSVTDQRTADERIPHLLRTPAAHRGVSIAPMRRPVDWSLILTCLGEPALYGLEAMILEGQSGPQAVPLDLEWVRLIRDQCQAAGVAFAFKQGSGLHPEHEPELDGKRWPISGLPWMRSRT